MLLVFSRLRITYEYKYMYLYANYIYMVRLLIENILYISNVHVGKHTKSVSNTTMITVEIFSWVIDVGLDLN